MPGGRRALRDALRDHRLAGDRQMGATDWPSHARLFEDGIIEVACWSHARRYVFKSLETDGARARHALAVIQSLFKLEREYASASLPEKLRRRQLDAKPLVDAFFAWCNEESLEVLNETPVSKAIGYARNQRAALRRCRFAFADTSISAPCASFVIRPPRACWPVALPRADARPSGWPARRQLALREKELLIIHDMEGHFARHAHKTLSLAERVASNDRGGGEPGGHRWHRPAGEQWHPGGFVCDGESHQAHYVQVPMLPRTRPGQQSA